MPTLEGLSAQEVAVARARYGPNALAVPRHRLLRLVLRQFRGVFNILLLIAAGLTFALGQPMDGAFILLFVLLGSALNVYQEHKSNAAADMLRTYLVRRVRVRRGGRDEEVPSEEIVPGDLLKLESGDIVAADAILRQARDLLVDETTFTGESVPVVKQAAAPGTAEPADGSRVLQGVVVIHGNALAEVTATGARTRLAGIGAKASTVQAESALVTGVDRISGFTLRAALVTILFVVLANLLIEGRDANVPMLLVFAIALAVSVIPEALPLVLTFSLSRGALQFARRRVIVKRLSSVFDLGSVDLLCTDKTGTITENRLAYRDAHRAAGARFHPLVLARLAAHPGRTRAPEPFDRAIEEALTPGQREEAAPFEVVEEEAFDPELRSNGAVVRRADGLRLHIRRGAPESILEPADAGDAEGAAAWVAQEEVRGRRVLAVRCDDGSGARFAGCVSFVDTLKATTMATIEEARRLNVAITIVTGDAVRVAEAVGREAGLVTRAGEVVEASAFLALPPREQRERAGAVRVFARTTPEQKLALIELLKERFTVGFLGEGINDALALKAAHVSMTVQSAADVARETADIVLLDADLRVVVDGIRLGRETHANTLKYIRATLVSNFGNFYSVAIGSLFISFLPMLPKQLLLLNFLSDFPMMAIAFDRVSAQEVARPQRYDYRSFYVIILVLGLVSTVFDFIYFGLFYRISPGVLQTNWFIGSVLTELFLLVSIRSLLPIEKAGRPATVVLALSAGAIAMTLALPSIPWTAAWFGFTRPTAAHLGLITAIAAVYLVASELVKRPLVRLLRGRAAAGGEAGAAGE